MHLLILQRSSSHPHPPKKGFPHSFTHTSQFPPWPQCRTERLSSSHIGAPCPVGPSLLGNSSWRIFHTGATVRCVLGGKCAAFACRTTKAAGDTWVSLSAVSSLHAVVDRNERNTDESAQFKPRASCSTEALRLIFIISEAVLSAPALPAACRSAALRRSPARVGAAFPRAAVPLSARSPAEGPRPVPRPRHGDPRPATNRSEPRPRPSAPPRSPARHSASLRPGAGRGLVPAVAAVLWPWSHGGCGLLRGRRGGVGQRSGRRSGERWGRGVARRRAWGGWAGGASVRAGGLGGASKGRERQRGGLGWCLLCYSVFLGNGSCAAVLRVSKSGLPMEIEGGHQK